ncbi:MAG: PAS domain S-box protein [Candidatus Auribacterota bacterium]|jgi:PAS domain S-box-containing protein|nr:PAS domain S-box protein [Candidatus Auribacterota bacterium]
MDKAVPVLLACEGEIGHGLAKLLVNEGDISIRALIDEKSCPAITQLAEKYDVPLIDTWNKFAGINQIDLIIDASEDNRIFSSISKSRPVYVHSIEADHLRPVICIWLLKDSHGERIDKVTSQIHEKIRQYLIHLTELKKTLPIASKTRLFDRSSKCNPAMFYTETTSAGENAGVSIPDRSYKPSSLLVSRPGGYMQKNSEDHFLFLFEHAPLPYQSLDENGFFIEVNNTWLQVLGYKRSEVIGKWFGEFLEPASLEKFKRSFSKFKKNGTVSGTELCLKHKNGGCILVSYEGRISYDDNGSFLQTHCIFHDITSRKQMEESLRQSEQRYRTIIETANEGIWITDKDGLITFANTHFADMLGYSQNELTGKPLISMIAHEWRSHAEMFLHGNDHKDSRHQDFKFIRADNSQIWALVSVSPLMSETGVPNGRLGMVIDITDRKKFEKQLDEYRSHLEHLVDQRTADLIHLNTFKENILSNIPSAIIVIDENLHIVTYNNNFLDLIDSKTEINGQHICAMLGCSKEAQKKCPVKTAIKNILINDSAPKLLEHTVNHNGIEKLFKIRMSRVSPNQQKILLVLEDITHQKNMEKQLLLSERLAATGRLAASIAHEINSPLQGIVTHLDLIKEKLPANFSEMDSYYAVKNNIDKIRDIVRQLLDIYITPQTSRSTVNINTIVRQVESIVRNQLSIKEVKLNLDLDERLPDINGYHQQLHQIILNVMLNAIDSTRKGDRISISTSSSDKKVSIIISDTGQGIPKEYLDHIFDPFVSAKRQSGVGLGLFVCQGLVKNHQGTISIDSRPEKGMTCTLTFPIEAVATEE